MCSVVGCDSWCRSAQRFNLPEDPEKRLEWVQFLAEVNGQRFKESSWTDITICIEHFANDCYESLTDTVQLKPRAVPSLFVKSEPEEPDPEHTGIKCEEPLETQEVSYQCFQIKTCDSPAYYSEESSAPAAAQGSPAPSDVSCSADTADAGMYDYGQMLQRVKNLDMIREKAALLQKKGQYVVNEKRLLKLFNLKCPLCGSKLKVEKITHGILIIMNQQCLQCEYRNQWKSQVNASVPTAHLTGGIDVTLETQQELSIDDNHSSITGVSEIVAVIDEQSDPMDETDSSDDSDMGSDEEWNPAVEISVVEELQSESAETEYEDDDYPAPRHSQLCTECGMFFNKLKPHTCEHKIKPYSCNICGKRCVTKTALNTHSRIHDDNYEHRCKYCHVIFKTKVDKITHEQIHISEEKPYKCTDCSENFATNKQRRVHLKVHGGPRTFKCNICGIEFVSHLNLQRHEVVHTGVKSYKCSVCQRGFNQAGHLKSHMRLHTGERPFKCQHCDKCFNHNVSLKSHVQRYHTSKTRCEHKKRINKRASDSGDAQENGDKRGSDSEHDNVEEDYTDSEVQDDRMGIPKKKRKKRSTGRPIGRPKSSATGSIVQTEGQVLNSKNAKVKPQKLKRTCYSDEESEDQQTESDTSFDPADEEEVMSKRKRKSKNSDSDSDFDPEQRKKMSSQRTGKSSGKRRGRPRKNKVL
ncbi:zinc finger protein 37-like [Scomber scombrus]|uniref:Zinc finger protein 37-like n=1 Tax=Scomber scombrus TaxID=13677 RepID=A0AAV1P6G4_SCOSC